MRQTPRRNTTQGEQVLDIPWSEMSNISSTGKAGLGPSKDPQLPHGDAGFGGEPAGETLTLPFPQTPQATGAHVCGPEQRPPARL